jgi:hypothetical protein
MAQKKLMRIGICVFEYNLNNLDKNYYLLKVMQYTELHVCIEYHVVIFAVILFLFTIGYIGHIYDNSYAISPSFDRQEVKDYSNQWNLINYNNNRFQSFSSMSSSTLNNLVNAKIGNIDSVSYISNGKFLNVTFWLTTPFQERPVKNIPNFIVTINADHNFLTGADKGIDYRVIIKWDNSSKRWQKIFEETSSLGNTRYLDLVNNYTGFFNKNDSTHQFYNTGSYYPNPCCYVTIPIDLGLINYPKQYIVNFATVNFLYDKERKPIYVFDGTSQVAIPPSRFFVVPEQNSFEMRAGEEKKIRLELNSTSFLPVMANLSLTSTVLAKDIDAKITPNQVYIQPGDIATSLLHIKSSIDSETGPYTFTISAKVSLPQVNNTDQYSFKSVAPSIFSQSNVIATIKDPPTVSEQFSSFWGVYGGAIGLIGGGFIGGFSGYIFARLEKKGKNG